MPDESKPELKPCKRCDGRGKVDSRDKKSWRRFSGMDPAHPDQKAIYASQIVPELCPDCEGSGYLPKPSDLQKAADEKAATAALAQTEN